MKKWQEEKLARDNSRKLTDPEVGQRKEKQKLEEEAKARQLAAIPQPLDPSVVKRGAGREVLDLGDPKFYHGLTKSEVDELFEFTKPLYSDVVRNPEGERLKSQIFHFLIDVFNDTTRTFGWTEWEKQKLTEFRSEAERLRGLGLLSPVQKVGNQK
jgi:hypothetical protein